MENLTYIEFRQVRDFSKKLNATFEFLRQNFKSLGKALIFIAGPTILISGLLTGGLYSNFFEVIIGTQQNPDGMANFIGSPSTWIKFGLALISMVISGVMVISVVYNYLLEYEARRSADIDTDAIWLRVRTTLPGYIMTFFIFFAIMIAAYLAIVLLIAGTIEISPGLAVLFSLAFFAGTIYLLITLSLLFIVRAYEDIGIAEAVSRCFTLIQGKWWSTFALLLVAGLVQSMLSSVFFIPWYVNFIITALHTVQGNLSEPSLVSQFINNVFIVLYFLASFVLYAVPLVALAFQYFNLVELKESRGLLARIESMGRPPLNKD
jgi:hypothetical protein